MSEIKTFETQLLGWAKSTSKKGPTITFQLLSDEDIEYFEAFTVAKGKTAGQLFDIAVSISSQDSQAQEIKQEKPKGGKLSQDAALLCKNPKFWEYAAYALGRDPSYYTDDIGPTEWLKDHCGIESRAELDHNREARILFKTLHSSFSRWVGE